uniref:Goadsporin biosynthetic protein n=1 Tax=Streptomyces sp. TP-A0584 TaxID=314563 RepID=Q3C2F9_9ACTN|nr:goadsporin biosynthetic protein [Streptomyces sp. TP-A0584]
MLLFEPSSDFEPGGVHRSLRHQAADWFSPRRRWAVVIAVALGLFQGLVVIRAIGARGLGMVTSAAVAGLISVCLQLLYARLQEGMSEHLTHRVIEKLAELPAEFFARRRPMALVARVGLVDVVAAQFARRLVPAAVAVVTASVVLTGTVLTVSPWIAALALGSFVGSLFVARMADHAARDEHAVVASQLARDGIIGAALSAPETLAAENGGGDLLRALERTQKSHIASQRTLYMKVQSGLRRVASYDTALNLSVWFMVVWAAAPHPESRDHAMAVLLAGAFLAMQQGVLLRAYVEVKGLRPKLAVLDDILGTPSCSRLQPTGTASCHLPEQAGRAARMGQLKLQDVSFRYTPTQAAVVRQATLTVRCGEMVHIIGSSGSGKSTLARLLAGILAPSSGAADLDVRRLAYVAQSSSFFFAGTIADNIALGSPLVSSKDIEDALKPVGLTDAVAKREGPHGARVTTDGTNFSGGQRQALALARALARRPDALIVDCATSAMDSAQERHILTMLRGLGLTTVCLRSDDRLAELADAVYVLEEGGLTPCTTLTFP